MWECGFPPIKKKKKKKKKNGHQNVTVTNLQKEGPKKGLKTKGEGGGKKENVKWTQPHTQNNNNDAA